MAHSHAQLKWQPSMKHTSNLINPRISWRIPPALGFSRHTKNLGIHSILCETNKAKCTPPNGNEYTIHIGKCILCRIGNKRIIKLVILRKCLFKIQKNLLILFPQNACVMFNLHGGPWRSTKNWRTNTFSLQGHLSHYENLFFGKHPQVWLTKAKSFWGCLCFKS